MATDRVYHRDAYLREAEATVVGVESDRVLLDRTIFYAESGGQMADLGEIAWDAGACRVVDVQPRGDDVEHRVEGPTPQPGTRVRLSLDWQRRYGLMRNHTVAHVLCGVVHQRWGALSTGNQLYPDKGRADFEFGAWTAQMREEIEAAVNDVLARDLPVVNRWISREEFEKGGLVRTKQDLVDPSLAEVRLTDIVGFDVQADGGTHVRRLGEVGRVRLGKVENKGKGIRRLEWTLGTG